MRKRLILKVLMSLFIVSLIGCTDGKENNNVVSTEINGVIEIDYFDVGQGDSALIQVNGKSMLIDAGTNDTEDTLVQMIKDEGIKKLDYVIGTHPHEDHIGGLDKVIDNFEVGEIIMPEVKNTTKTFESVLKSAAKKEKKIKKAKPGIEIDLGEGTNVEVFSPGKDKYKELNNYSPIMKITYGENSFLFTGDAEKEVEKEVINNGYNLKSDVIKVGHHGSTTSTTEEFLNLVNPEIAVISVSKENTYGHPEKKILDRLKNKNIKILRTDEIGSIEIISDGKSISINK